MLAPRPAVGRDADGSAIVHSTKHEADVFVSADVMERALLCDDSASLTVVPLQWVTTRADLTTARLHQTVLVRFKVASQTERKVIDATYVAQRLQLVEVRTNEPGERMTAGSTVVQASSARCSASTCSQPSSASGFSCRTD